MLNDDALEYMRVKNLPKVLLQYFIDIGQRSFANDMEWTNALEVLGITKKHNIRIATEGALLGSVIEHGINPELVIMSDDAGQFNVFLHALCWIHAERTINKLSGFTEKLRVVLEKTRSKIWDFYQDLKAYREEPSAEEKAALNARFDEIFNTKTCFATLNQALNRIYKNKAELLLVLERPEIPLHNNLSERDIREYVKKRKISGSTRSSSGRSSRDTFASLKKTCRKLGISFWKFLMDRLSGQSKILPLPELIRQSTAKASPQ